MKLSKHERSAMKHPNKLGAGAEKRRRLSPTSKKRVVQAEWEQGTLHSGSGQIVPHTEQGAKQMWAIANSEARKFNKYLKKHSK